MGHCDGCGADFEDGTEHNCGGSDESQDEGSQDENQWIKPKNYFYYFIKKLFYFSIKNGFGFFSGYIIL